MAMPTGAGSLCERFAFDRRGTASDGGGGTTTIWQEQFSRRAALVQRNSGEAVMADRLQGKRSIVIRVRSDSQTRSVAHAWRARDLRTGQAFNILDVTETSSRRWIDIFAQAGGPNG